jgi:arginase family enzyme
VPTASADKRCAAGSGCWLGAHLSDQAEGDPGYTGLAGTVPMLPPRRLAILGYDDSDIDPRERHLLNAPVSHADGKHVAADPIGAAAAARVHVEASAGAIVVHFDVDVVDSADLPLANYPHHGKGLTLATAVTVLRELCASPAFTGLVLTEVNPPTTPAANCSAATSTRSPQPSPNRCAPGNRATPPRAAGTAHPGRSYPDHWHAAPPTQRDPRDRMTSAFWRAGSPTLSG